MPIWTSTNYPPSTSRPMGPTSFWNQPLVAAPVLNANSKFESGVPPWTGQGCTISVEPTTVYSGRLALQVTPNNTTINGFGPVSQVVPVTAGKLYRATVWVNFPFVVNGTPYSFAAGIDWYNASQVNISTSYTQVNVSPTNTWVKVKATFTAPAGAFYGTVHPLLFSGSPTPTTNVWYIDNTTLQLEPSGVNSQQYVNGLCTRSFDSTYTGVLPLPPTVGVAGTVSDYGQPVYYSQATDPLYTIHSAQYVSGIEAMQVRIPANAKPAQGTDGHMIVVDQTGGYEWDFWRVGSQYPAAFPGNAQQTVGQIGAIHSGIIPIGEGERFLLTGNGQSANYGANAANTALSMGPIRPEEMGAGTINHALAVVTWLTDGTFVPPASGLATAGGTPPSGALWPHDGQCFMLDLSLQEIGALNLPPWEEAILRAAHLYGMYITDTGANGHNSFNFYLQSGQDRLVTTGVDPWIAVAQNYGWPPFGGPPVFYQPSWSANYSWINSLITIDSPH